MGGRLTIHHGLGLKIRSCHLLYCSPTMSPRLLLIAHDPSPNLQRLRCALLEGIQEGSAEVQATYSPALKTEEDYVLKTNAVILLTPENLGYMSGGMKDFFDRCYYGLLDKTQGLPFALVVRAGTDGTGTRRAVESICAGLKWKAVQAPLICRGEWREQFVDQCRELGATLSAGVDAGVF